MRELLYLVRETDDDRAFLDVADALVDAAVEPFETVAIIRVRGWFDHKWLRFSGNGRVDFDSRGLRGFADVALDSFRQDKLTFPPFTPRRIFAAEDAPDRPVVHRRRRQQSARNLQRRVENHAASFGAFWISTGSDVTGRASVMHYATQKRAVEAWYASFRRDDGEWRLNRTKGTPAEPIVALLSDLTPPRSGPTTRGWR